MARVTSWGRYPALPQTTHTCSWRDELPTLLNKMGENYHSTLPFGRGRSYGDSCLAASDHVIDMSGLDRFISFDNTTGIIVAEAGVTLSDLLSLVIPHGWFLPVTPGTKYVTLGGALANDVHGKNHHKRGTIAQYVRKFHLHRSDRESMICSQQENADYFAATVGGLGLIGIIDWVELQLIPIKSSQINITQMRFNSLREFFALSNEWDQNNEYSVAWIDCLAKGNSTGRGVFTVGNHADEGTLTVDHGSKLLVPFTPPISAVNKYSLHLFNNLYFNTHNKENVNKTIGYEPFFYPLDKILHWNRLYGKKGFQQYQCVIPAANAEDALNEMLNIIATAEVGSFLSVLKRCGDIKSPGILSFPLAGTSLALDFSQSEKLSGLFPRLDTIVRTAKGRLYPAKDAHMEAKDFQQFYPSWEMVDKLRDPLLCSHFWKRVTK